MYALRRAVEAYEPSIFVPALIKVVSPTLEDLRAPLPTLHGQACHALGSLSLCTSKVLLSYTHT
jgi:hypothetical protein